MKEIINKVYEALVKIEKTFDFSDTRGDLGYEVHLALEPACDRWCEQLRDPESGDKYTTCYGCPLYIKRPHTTRAVEGYSTCQKQFEGKTEDYERECCRVSVFINDAPGYLEYLRFQELLDKVTIIRNLVNEMEELRAEVRNLEIEIETSQEYNDGQGD